MGSAQSITMASSQSISSESISSESINALYIKSFQVVLHESLGSQFWQDHEEAPRLLQWVRAVDEIVKWLEEATEYYNRLIQHYRGDESFHLPDNYIDARFGDIRRCLDVMEPYLTRCHGCLEDATRHITVELWSGNLHWFELFSELIGMVSLDGDRWLYNILLPVVGHLKISVERVVAVTCEGGSMWGCHSRVGGLKSSFPY